MTCRRDLDLMLTLEDAVADLERITRVVPLAPDVPVIELPLDSMDVMEWLFGLEEAFGVVLDESELGELEVERITLASLFDLILAAPKRSSF